ncbi:hypothetical protein [Zhihengliuella halotolerans]|uniref:Uncharacterized protein n=1 Tax=Zhihengliuella halotolerans TaxID=370736 RepID=A0A4Q8AEM6_9MICC|nr:hypothetical protein [Zhihengliuella halotolerans]RZU62271.1 hypothetical protein EV380_1864 [Zhihengliuella halotolerans]
MSVRSAQPGIPPWLEAAPPRRAQPRAESWQRFISTGDRALLRHDEPLWEVLQWAAERGGFLLHGTQRGGLDELQPRAPLDRSPDEFSKRRAVFGSSDAIWAMCYALRGPSTNGMLNSCVHIESEGAWTPPHYFLSLSGSDQRTDLLQPGWVHLIDKGTFERMKPYEWAGVERVLEAQWVSSCSVPVHSSVRVLPQDLPIRCRLHSAEAVERASADNPAGFPWLESPPYSPLKAGFRFSWKAAKPSA